MAGPGQTKFIPNDDNSISCRRWDDLSWQTSFLSQHDFNAAQVAHALARAYQMGFEDRATLIRNALGEAQ